MVSTRAVTGRGLGKASSTKAKFSAVGCPWGRLTWCTAIDLRVIAIPSSSSVAYQQSLPLQTLLLPMLSLPQQRTTQSDLVLIAAWAFAEQRAQYLSFAWMKSSISVVLVFF